MCDADGTRPRDRRVDLQATRAPAEVVRSRRCQPTEGHDRERDDRLRCVDAIERDGPVSEAVHPAELTEQGRARAWHGAEGGWACAFRPTGCTAA